MRPATIIAAVLTLTLSVSSRGHAQLPDDVIAGTRIRATLSNGHAYIGTIMQMRGDSLVVRDGAAAPINIISSREITALDVSRGRPVSRWNAMKWGGIAGALIGGFVGYKHYDITECYPPSTACRNTDIIVGGLQGAAIGGAVGLASTLIRGEQWEKVLPR